MRLFTRALNTPELIVVDWYVRICFEPTSCDERAFGAVQIGLPSKVKIFNDEHRHKNSTCVMSLTLLLMIK